MLSIIVPRAGRDLARVAILCHRSSVPDPADALVIGVGGDSRLASVQLAGSIASWIVARLFWMNAVRAAPSRIAGATAARRPVAR